MEVVDPMQIGFLSIPPGAIRPLILGRVLHRLLRQHSIFFVARVRISPSQQASAERIRIVYLAVLDPEYN